MSYPNADMDLLCSHYIYATIKYIFQARIHGILIKKRHKEVERTSKLKIIENLEVIWQKKKKKAAKKELQKAKPDKRKAATKVNSKIKQQPISEQPILPTEIVVGDWVAVAYNNTWHPGK